MLWALAQRYTDMEKARKEGREEGRKEGLEAGREQGRDRILQALAERGVELPRDILDDLNGSRQE